MTPCLKVSLRDCMKMINVLNGAEPEVSLCPPGLFMLAKSEMIDRLVDICCFSSVAV